jgi:hypothetical protein
MVKNVGIRELFRYLSKLLRENGFEKLADQINTLVTEYRRQLVFIEDSYVDSRYENVEYGYFNVIFDKTKSKIRSISMF